MPAAELSRAVRRIVGCHVVGDHLSSGAHATIDAVGSEGSVREALSITRPRGRVVMMGMPAEVTLDLTGLWHRETELVGAYTYGTETLADGTPVRTFDLAMATADAIEAERWLSETYPLADHVDAIAHAAAAGRRGAIKIAFDLRDRRSTCSQHGSPECHGPDSSSTSTARRHPRCSGTARASASSACPPTAAG